MVYLPTFTRKINQIQVNNGKYTINGSYEFENSEKLLLKPRSELNLLPKLQNLLP